MPMNLFDRVVLMKDLPEHRLKKGDLGTVVGIYDPGGLEVEFVMGTGRTLALITLSSDDVRPLAESDVLAVRSGNRK